MWVQEWLKKYSYISKKVFEDATVTLKNESALVNI